MKGQLGLAPINPTDTVRYEDILAFNSQTRPTNGIYLPAATAGAGSVIQTNSATLQATQILCSLATLPAVGNAIIAILTSRGNPTVSSMVDNQSGNTFTKVAAAALNGTQACEIWYCQALVNRSGAYAVTATISSSAPCVLTLMEVNGTSFALDKSGTFSPNTSPQSATVTASAANASATCLVVAGIASQYEASPCGISNPPVGYTAVATYDSTGGFQGVSQVSYKFVSAIETSACTWTATTAIPSVAAAIATFSFTTAPKSVAITTNGVDRVVTGPTGNVVINAPSTGGGSALTLPAGTTTSEPLLLTSGALLTTPAAGATEYDGTVQYFTPSPGARAISLVEYACILSAPYALTSQTAVQKLFNASANGALTLPVGVYIFECEFALYAMSATSGSFGFALGGTATFTQAWQAIANKPSAFQTAAAGTESVTFNIGANAALAVASTTTYGTAKISGVIRVTAAGTIIPQVSLGVAAAANVATNSFFRARPMGGASNTLVGNWS